MLLHTSITDVSHRRNAIKHSEEVKEKNRKAHIKHGSYAKAVTE